MYLNNIRGKRTFRNVNGKRIDWKTVGKSKFQKTIKDALYPLWASYIVYEEFPVYGSRLTLDFFNATKMVAIEVQGNQHIKFTPYFHKNEMDFRYQLMKDDIKQMFCDSNGIKLIQIFTDDLKCGDLTQKLKELGA